MGENLTSKVYHKDVFLPEKVKQIPERICIFYGIMCHALESAKDDELREIEIPNEIYFSGKEIVECEISSEGIKFIVRLPYDRNNDIMYCVLYDNEGKAILKTVWLNDMFDFHKTLDESKYATL